MRYRQRVSLDLTLHDAVLLRVQLRTLMDLVERRRVDTGSGGLDGDFVATNKRLIAKLTDELGHLDPGLVTLDEQVEAAKHLHRSPPRRLRSARADG